MAIRFYDDALVKKIQSWIPSNSDMTILKPEEVSRLFQIKADANNDKPLTLPIIAISRDSDVSAQNNIWVKKPMTFDGYMLESNEKSTKQLNAIGIVLNYQIDIFTKKYEEGDEYLRNFLFNFVNHPELKVVIPYNNSDYVHTSNIKVMSPISDTSDVPLRLFPGQFTRWTFKLEIDDAYIFAVPVVNNVSIGDLLVEMTDTSNEEKNDIEKI